MKPFMDISEAVADMTGVSRIARIIRQGGILETLNSKLITPNS
jgi:hypothetical protein